MSNQHLSALDATFVELEDADPTAHMHIGAVLVFEGSAPDHDALLARVQARLPSLPRLRQSLLADAGPGALHRPVWGAAPHFDARHHVRRAALPAPADDDELLAWAGDFYSRRLDRRRPLWELVLIEGLSGDRWALASKTHHCLADGVGSLDTLRLCADGADAPPAPPPPGSSEPRLADAVRAGLNLARHPVDAVARAAAVGELAIREELAPAPASSLNEPIGTERRLLAVHTDLALLRNVKDALGGHVNDVALAVVTAGLRALLQERHGTVPVPELRAMVPVSVRDGAAGGMGNRIVSMFVGLPVGEADPFRRYERIRTQTDAAKRGHQPAGAAGLLSIGEWLPPVVHARFARSLFGKRLFNVTVTNVPGPPFEVRVLGSKLVRAVPLVPLAAEHAVGVAILSYDGRVTFGVVADADSVPEADRMATAMEPALNELAGLATAAALGRELAG